MIKLFYQGKNYAIATAVKKANEILQNPAFYERVAVLPQMLNTELSSLEIATILRETNQEIQIESFWNPFSKSSKVEQPCLVRVNTYNLSCITAFAVNTIINETILSLALKCTELNFVATNMYEIEHPNVFPWRIGEIAEILTRKSRQSAMQAQFN